MIYNVSLCGLLYLFTKLNLWQKSNSLKRIPIHTLKIIAFNSLFFKTEALFEFFLLDPEINMLWAYRRSGVLSDLVKWKSRSKSCHTDVHPLLSLAEWLYNNVSIFTGALVVLCLNRYCLWKQIFSLNGDFILQKYKEKTSVKMKNMAI